MKAIEMLIKTNDLFWNHTVFFVLYLISILALYIIKDKNSKVLVWYPLLVMGLIIYNPFIYYILKLFFTDSTEYVRLFYILPINFTLAYMACIVLDMVDTKLRRLLMISLLLIIIIVSGKTFYFDNTFVPRENWYKLPQEILDIHNYISGVNEPIVMLIPDDLRSYMRQYDAGVRYTDMGSPTLKDFKEENYDVQGLRLVIEFKECNYIVSYNDKELVDYYKGWGYNVIGTAKNYIILNYDN